MTPLTTCERWVLVKKSIKALQQQNITQTNPGLNRSSRRAEEEPLKNFEVSQNGTFWDDLKNKVTVCCTLELHFF